jgi:hypothetical protein
MRAGAWMTLVLVVGTAASATTFRAATDDPADVQECRRENHRRRTSSTFVGPPRRPHRYDRTPSERSPQLEMAIRWAVRK